jgi:cell division protein FtsL
MILGLVALNAVLAQTSFRIDDLATKVKDLGNQNAELRKTVAVASAPGRVYRWADKEGMITPDPRDVHVLHPPSRAVGAGAGTGAGAGGTP